MKTKVTLLGLHTGKLEEAKIHDNFVELAMPVVGTLIKSKVINI